MKFENIIKSLMIAGLLAGATEVNAAKVGAIGCEKVTVTNQSGKTNPWALQVKYTDCKTRDVQTSDAYVRGETGTFSILSGSPLEVWQGNGHKPNWEKYNNANVQSSLHIVCSGDYGTPKCQAED